MNELAKNNQKMRLVMLGDIRHSRLLTDRSSIQTGLRRLTAQINREMASLISVPFSISGGDEIQALLADPGTLYEVVDNIDLTADLFGMRFGIGWGPLSTPHAERTWEMDGECFHHARQAIAQGKKEDRWVTVGGMGDDGDKVINGVFRLVQVIREGWTDKQRTAVAARKAAITQTQTAEQLGLDTSTLSKMLKAAQYKQLTEMEEAMPALIRRWLGVEP